MTRLNFIFTGAAVALSSAALMTPVEAQAQDASISEIIVYGTDPCPRSTDDEVVVCARKPEGERYRIPERLRSSGPRQSRQAWANKAKALETVGATGPNTCSPVGPGGFTGCLQQVIRQAHEERKEQVDVETAPEE
ncbi:MAG: hypothetical protein ABIO29_07765 [Sphingomicrobium sp.]